MPKNPLLREPLLCFISRASGALAAATGLLVVISWYTGWTGVIHLTPALAPMHFNTAVGFILCGAALFSLTVRNFPIAFWLGCGAAVLGGTTLAEYLLDRNLGIDYLCVNSRVQAAAVACGRMAPPSALCLLSTGLGLALAGVRRSAALLAATGMLACVTAMIALVAILGHLFGIETTYAWSVYTGIAAHTAATFMILSAGLLLWSWREAPARAKLIHWLPVTASVTLMMMIALITRASFVQLDQSNRWHRHVDRIVRIAGSLLGDLADTQRGARGYILSGRPDALDLYRSAVANIPLRLDTLQALIGDDREQRPRLAKLRAGISDVLAYSGRLLDTGDQSGMQAMAGIESTGEGLFVMNRTRADLQALVDSAQQQLDERMDRVNADFGNTKRLVTLGSALAVALLLFAHLTTAREVKFRRRSQTDFEAELDRNRRLLDGILKNTSDGIIAYDAVRDASGVIRDFKFSLINPAAQRISRLSAPTDIGRRLLEVFPAARNGALQSFVEVVETGRSTEFEYYEGQITPPRWYRVAASKLGDGLAVTYMEITERKRAEETLRLSEERFRLMLDGVKDYALFMLGPDGTILSWNTGAERLKGYMADEIIGKHFRCFYSPSDQLAGHPEEELRIAAREGRFEEEGWRIRKDGSRFLANVVTTAVRDDAGELRGFAKVTRDITLTRKLDKAVRDQAQILDLVNDTIFVRDSADKIIYWNHGAERTYGWTKEEAIGRVTHSFLKTRFPQPFPQIEAELRAEGHWEGELEHVRRDGSVLTVASRWMLQTGDVGEPVRIIETNYDLTDRKAMEHALRDKNRDLEMAARAKDRFLANMSHELRTPLNGIIGFTQLLADGLPGPVNARQTEYLQDVLNSAQHLLQLINDLLDLSKVASGKMELHPESFQLQQALEQVCAGIQPLVRTKQIKLVKRVSPLPERVTLDPQRFKQILYNLLSNAVKFTHPEGSVEIVTEPLGEDRFTLSVRDTGIGIAPENLKRLFKEFEQLDNGTTRRYEGTGLGLALTRNLVDMQGGNIRVESELGKGTTFTVTLPSIMKEALT